MGLTLRELGEERRVLDQFLAETDGEETVEIAELMAELTGTTAQKVDNWCSWIKEREVEVEALKAEQARVLERRQHLEAAIVRSKAQLQRELEIQGHADGYRGVLHTAGIQYNQASVAGDVDAEGLARWENDEFLRAFVRVKVARELDRKALLARFKPGEVLPGGLAIVRGRSLRIR